MLAQALLVAASGFTTSPLYHSSLRSRAHAPIAMSVVKAEGTPENLESLLSQAEAATGIVCLAVTEPQHQLSNMQIERAGATYASSMLYGGPSCSILQVMCSDAASALALLTDRLQQKAPLELPLVATYSKGALKAVVTPTALEETLLALGARSATSKSNTASRDFGATGGPSATAVDEIDFTVRQQSAVESLRHTPASPAHGLVVPPPCESRPASTACASWIADLPAMCVCVCVCFVLQLYTAWSCRRVGQETLAAPASFPSSMTRGARRAASSRARILRRTPAITSRATTATGRSIGAASSATASPAAVPTATISRLAWRDRPPAVVGRPCTALSLRRGLQTMLHVIRAGVA